MSLDPKWTAQLLLFTTTGKCSAEFFHALGTDPVLQKACDNIFRQQVARLKAELHPVPLSGTELMALIFDDIAHGDAAHREWLKDKLDAWASRVEDATVVAAIRHAAENVLDCAQRHPDRLECCYAMDAMLQAALDGESEHDEVLQLRTKVEQMRAALKIYEPHQSKCSCGLVCSAATLAGHLRDCPDHTDASPMRIADMP